ncbi:MAG: SAM-dependent methyltransferase [Verrucomicrobia bacterium]|nr:SAM-dependent methyltransferase [Verrucomicrobiota bacterium]
MNIETLFLLSFLFLIVVSLLLVLTWTIRNGISPMPTAPKVAKKLLEVIPVKEGARIVELGSGWGTLAFLLAQKYPSCRVLGFENSPLPYLFSRVRQRPNLCFKYKDFFDESFAEADLIVCYLCPSLMKRLKEKFEKELRPGTVVVSHTFAVPGWEAQRVVFVDDLYRTPIYIYTMKADG